MTSWVCGIAGCGEGFGTAEELVRHQTVNHPKCECAVCGETIPSGFLAIRHAFDEHTRAEYVRAYDADSDDIRLRERVTELVEEQVDVPGLLTQLGDDGGPAVSVGD